MTGWRESLRGYLHPAVLRMLLLGFAGGLPLLLVYTTLSAWLKEAGVSKTTIGFVSLVGSAYSLKFLWAPLVDRLPLPPLTSLLGRRRGWLVASQAALAGFILAMAGTDPRTLDGLWWTVFWAVAVAFASATQDILIDAYRVESLDADRQGHGAAAYVYGYRIGMLVSGAGALVLADVWGWHRSYAAMAGLMCIGVATVLASPEPRAAEPAPGAAAGAARGTGGALVWLRQAVVDPFADFTRRRAWLAVLLFVALFKYGEALLGVMAVPFYLELGFSKTEIGAISKVFGTAMTLAGTGLGGLLVARLGLFRTLLVSGVLQALSNLVFALQALVGHDRAMLSVTIAVDNLSGGMATAAFLAYLASLCSVAYTATQYALLSSLGSVGRTVFASVGGWLADRLGWVEFFLLTTLAAVPGLVLLLWLMRTYGAAGERRAREERRVEPGDLDARDAAPPRRTFPSRSGPRK